MKNFYILEILLLSQKEKKGKKVLFDRHRTIILGKNNTGKSSLIKSIYWAFGAEPIMHPNFKLTQTAVLVRFSFEDIIYEILRDNERYSLFDGESKELIRTFNSVSKELAPYFSELFNFKPLFQTKSHDFIVPPPAFLILPFYIDQDSSWSRSWSSFNRINYIKDYRLQLISYHAGIRPNEYYLSKKELEIYNNKIDEIERERKLTNKISKQIRTELTQVEFNIDIEIFRDEVRDLLLECDILKKAQEKAKYELRDLYNLKSSVESQIDIVNHSLNETHADLTFASNILSDHVGCPTCGAIYENSFTERFAIANDEEKCKDLLIELSKDLFTLTKKIEEQNFNLKKSNVEYRSIESILEQKKDEIKLKDVLENYGKNQLSNVFVNRISTLNSELLESGLRKSDLAAKIKAFEDKVRRKEIENYFQSTLTKFLRKLDVHSIDPDSYKSLYRVMAE